MSTLSDKIQIQHDVQVVNHEVQDDVHVQTTRAKQAEPVNLEEKRDARDFLQSGNGGVKAFQVTDLQDALVLGRRVYQTPRRGQIGRDRLFHQDVDARCEQLASDFSVQRSGHCNHRRIDFALELTERSERQAIMLGRRLRRALPIGIHHAHQRGI